MCVKRWRILTVLYLILLTYLCLREGRAPDPTEPKILQILWPNVAHIPAYAILTYCLFQSVSSINPKVQMGIFSFAFSYGVLIEFLQGFVPYRYPSLSDVFLNLLGILSAFYLVLKVKPIKE